MEGIPPEFLKASEMKKLDKLCAVGSQHTQPVSKAEFNYVNGSCFLGQEEALGISWSNMRGRWYRTSVAPQSKGAVQTDSVLQGMRVTAIDRGKEKRELCKQPGAEEFIDYQAV